MNFNKVELVMTAGLTSQLPGVLTGELPQVAFCGRSNVGKSSLINKIIGRKSLARVSSEPGKTVTINCYEVDNSLHLVDLPGYGYAKRSFSERQKWKKLIDKYFSLDANRLYLQLVDLKVGLTKDDEEMLKYLIIEDLPFAIIATKADKLNKTNRAICLESLEKHELIPEDVAIIPFSTFNGEGTEEIRGILKEFCDFVKEHSN